MNNPGGKGDKRRPEARPGAYADGWELAFGKKRKKRDLWKEAKKQRPDLWDDGENDGHQRRRR